MTKMTRIFWTTQHIEKVVGELLKDFPELRYDDFSRLTGRDVEEAAKRVLEPAMHRDFRSGFTYTKKRLADFIATMPAPAPPPAPLVLAVEVKTAEAEPRGRQYTPQDWLLLAEEVHRQNPHFGWPFKEALTSLTQEELRAAQANVIPAEKRMKFTNMTNAREHMLEAFAIVRKRLDDEKAETDRVLELERQLSELRIEEERKKAELALTLAAATAPTVVPLADQIAQAAAPFVRMLAHELADAFAQALLPKMLEVMMAKPAAQEPEPSPPPPPPEKDEDPLDAQPPATYAGPEGVPPRPPKIGIIGPPHINQHLEGYADIDFVYIDRSTDIRAAIKSCEKIIGIDKFVNEAAKKALRQSDEAKSKYVPVSGGASRVKHQINLWLQAGELKPTARI